MFNLPKYGDEVMIDLGAGQLNGSVMHIDEHEIEFTQDGGDTSTTVWLDDLVDLVVIREA